MKEISLSEINIEEPLICVHFDEPESLLSSIKITGMLEPVLVTPFKNRYEIVDGWARVKVCSKLGIHSVKGLVLSLNSIKDGILTHLRLNAHRFSEGELMEIFNKLAENGAEPEKIAEEWNSLSKKRVSPETIKKLLEIKKTIPSAPLLLHRKEVTLTALKMLCEMPSEWIHTLIPLIKGKSSGEQIKFLKLILEGIFSGKLKSFKEIEAPSWNETYERCFSKLFPSVYKRKKKIEKLAKNLAISVHLPPFLEGDRIRISFEVDLMDDIERKCDEVKKFISTTKKAIIDEV